MCPGQFARWIFRRCALAVSHLSGAHTAGFSPGVPISSAQQLTLGSEGDHFNLACFKLVHAQTPLNAMNVEAGPRRDGAQDSAEDLFEFEFWLRFRCGSQFFPP
jgi:hypothetical protein